MEIEKNIQSLTHFDSGEVGSHSNSNERVKFNVAISGRRSLLLNSNLNHGTQVCVKIDNSTKMNWTLKTGFSVGRCAAS